MRVSCDLDGVLADMDGALAALADEEFAVPAKGLRRQQVTATKAAAQDHQTIAEDRADASDDTRPSTLRQSQRHPEQGGGATGSGRLADSADSDAGSDLPSAAVLSRLTARQQSRLWQRVRETRNFWESLKEHEPGIVRRLQHLAHQHQWDVLFVTQRPATAGRTAQVQSQRWLRRHGFDLPAVYTTQGSRGRIAAALTLDAHIDDRLENCVDIASDSKTWPILVWREQDSYADIAEGAQKLGIVVVRTVAEALTLLETGRA